jgi:hypothetical protein
LECFAIAGVATPRQAINAPVHPSPTRKRRRALMSGRSLVKTSYRRPPPPREPPPPPREPP